MTCLEALLHVISTALFLPHNDHLTYLCNPRLPLLLYYLPSILLVASYGRQKILHLSHDCRTTALPRLALPLTYFTIPAAITQSSHNDAVLPTTGSVTYPYLINQSTVTSKYPTWHSTFSSAILSIDVARVSKEGFAGQGQYKHRGNGV